MSKATARFRQFTDRNGVPTFINIEALSYVQGNAGYSPKKTELYFASDTPLVIDADYDTVADWIAANTGEDEDA